MLPFLTFGNLTLSTYALLYSLAFVQYGAWAYLRLRRPAGPPPETTTRRLLLVACSLLLGLYLPVLFPSLLQALRSGVWRWVGRESLLSGLVLGVLAGLWVAPRDVPLGWIFDRSVLPLPAALVVARLGCLAAGCCGGAVTTSAFSLFLPDEAGAWAQRYPVQPLMLALNLADLAFLMWMERRPVGSRRHPFEGSVFLAWGFLFCVQRFAVQFLRADYQPLLGPLSAVHLFTLGGALLSLALGLAGYGRARRAANA